MLRKNKKQNILNSLRDRELNSSAVPYKSSLNILGQLIRSENTFYQQSFYERSLKPISYDFGSLYFNNYTSSYTIYGRECKPSKSLTFKPGYAKKKVFDVITYTTPVCNTFENCNCKYSFCSCASKFILCLTEDNWLCQYNLNTGALMKEVYVKRVACNFRFRYCDWDEYATRVILTTGLNCNAKNPSKDDIVVNMAIFTVFPLEFSALLEIKRSVFGKCCKNANVDDQLLMLGMGYDRIHIYSFSDILAEGNISPYKIGEKYDLGQIGMYPTGLPLNLNIESAPPLLYDVQCFEQSICFGGYPYHCIYTEPKSHLRFLVQNMKDRSKNISLESDVWNDEPNIVYFHPDQSNRIIARELLKVCVYNLDYSNGELKLKESYRMELKDALENKIEIGCSRFGRKINRNNRVALSFMSERTIMATAFEDELHLFGILGVRSNDPKLKAFINLYESVSGKEIKSIELDQNLCETNYYQLYIDREVMVIIERDSKGWIDAYVYRIFLAG